MGRLGYLLAVDVTTEMIVEETPRCGGRFPPQRRAGRAVGQIILCDRWNEPFVRESSPQAGYSPCP